jgi:hypothetical protein
MEGEGAGGRAKKISQIKTPPELGELGVSLSKSLVEKGLACPQLTPPVGGKLGELGVSWGGSWGRGGALSYWCAFPLGFHRGIKKAP